MNFKKNVLLYTLIPLTILLVLTSYYRFVVLEDYTVAYEADCDPQTQICFSYCEDNDCKEPYYFAKIKRYAKTLNEICGDDVSNCEAASQCQRNELDCNISFCDATSNDNCDELGLGKEIIDTSATNNDLMPTKI
jgi:hypothetical protein